MKVEDWERRVEVPLLFLAFAFLIAYAWPVLDTELDHDIRSLVGGRLVDSVGSVPG